MECAELEQPDARAAMASAKKERLFRVCMNRFVVDS
jgi:hypothetical protein